MFQQHLTSNTDCVIQSWPSRGQHLVTNKKKVDYKLRSTHAHTVHKPQVDYEPRSAHCRAVIIIIKSSLCKPRTALGPSPRGQKKKVCVNLQPCSAYGHVINYPKAI